MQDQPQDPIQILAQMAREYQRKYSELEEALRNVPSDKAVHQLRMRAELTTDHFRGAQQTLLLSLTQPDAEGTHDRTFKAGMALCRCFDEMRILFQILLDYSSKSERSDP